ncbi:MAG: DUF2304 domain-containing protein [Lachnospiraceae bacterium]|jgi:hypothetical protein|nr:DUF2304 domain-containing protein [Lachnospiraceae bacterium]MBQ5558495.1 DUF2304 domain-containing protein [Lachnospiraceae bacterium]MCR4802652.1 DUF2304 domain-containing protein [Lachnospiraceae bacterium]
MSLKLQVLIVASVILFFIYIAGLLKKKKIDFKYALGWYALGFIVSILAVFPNFLAFLSRQIGIASPVNMLFFFGLILALCMIFSLSVSLSHANDRIKKLAQEIAILRRVNHEKNDLE